MSASSLAAWGILNPDDVVQVAAANGCALAAACALLEQESAGGHNVWGHDAVPTGGTYVKGGPVDEASYRAYRVALAAGTAGQQGVGPCQLTSVGYQDRADALGGCWLPVPNMRVGFALLATYARQWNLPDAFRAYNGGAGNRVAGRNLNADRYSDAAMDKYRRWVDRLGPGSATAPTTPEDDMPLTDADVDKVATAVTARLLNTQMADLYMNPPSGQTMTVAAHLQWAAANAGRALAVAKAIQAAMTSAAGANVGTALRDALDALGPLELVPTRELDHGTGA